MHDATASANEGAMIRARVPGYLLQCACIQRDPAYVLPAPRPAIITQPVMSVDRSECSGGGI
jgi:hypothetical protein